MPETQLNGGVTQPTAPVQQPTAPVQQPTAPVQQPTVPVLQQEKPRIYYHPSWLTKIVSGILRTYGIIMSWIGLLNLSIIFSNPENLDTIICCGGGFLLYGIGLIFAGSLFYNNKKWMHLGVSFLVMLLVNIFGSIVFGEYGGDFDDFDGDNYFFILGFFIQIYFLIVTIVWLIKCLIYKKKGASQKSLNPAKESKKISYIVLLVLFIVVAIDVIYGKILYLQIPKSDISSFVRVDHNVPLAEGEDGVAILKSKEKNEEINKIWNVLDLAYLSRFSVRGKHPSETNLSWEEYPDECIKVYSGGQAYCGTWAWSESTLRRLFRNQLGEDFVRLDETLEGRTISLYTYLEERESEIRKEVLEIDRVLSMNYNANNWLKNDLLPQFFQGYARGSVVLIEYYSLKNDWDMVLKLVENDLKMVDITNNFGGLIGTLISNAIEEIIYTSINSSIQVLPEDVRLKIAKLIEENNKDYSKMVKYIMQGEIENGNVSIDAVSSGYIYDGGLIQIFYHFPFYSESDSKRLVYNFYNVYNDFLNGKEVGNAQDFYQKIFDGESNFRWSIYNIKGMEILSIVAPRLQGGLSSIKGTYVHKESLLKNLESGTYKARYSEPEWNKNDDYYRASYIIEK